MHGCRERGRRVDAREGGSEGVRREGGRKEEALSMYSSQTCQALAFTLRTRLALCLWHIKMRENTGT